LQSTGILTSVASSLDNAIGNISIITMVIGVLSAIVDNVPLVAAAQGMYSLEQYPTDHFFWEFLAYCAGTGGSILIIGSAAGVAAMGMERIQFGWYLKKIAWLALIGYLAGAAVFLMQHYFLHL
jgi:Na+/H+ antiporter NhaD/arsenite permease-like protein